MNKKDVSKVLAQGSAKQRVMILAEDIAQYRLTRKGFLTDSETRALADSFKKDSEIKLYNRLIDFDKRVTHVLSYLHQLQLAYEGSIGYLTGYCLLWNSYQREEENYNQLLHDIKDKATRKKAIRTLITASPLLATTVAGKEEGTINILTTGEKKHDIEDLIALYSERATAQVKDAKALAMAILEYMDEERFNVKTYKNEVIKVLEALSQDRAVLPRYSRMQTLDLLYGQEEDIVFMQTGEKIKSKAKRMEKLFSKYWVFPDPAVEPDPKRVEWYKNEHIKD